MFEISKMNEFPVIQSKVTFEDWLSLTLQILSLLKLNPTQEMIYTNRLRLGKIIKPT